MNKTAVAMALVTAGLSFAHATTGDEEPATCPPDIPGTVCSVDPEPELCGPANNYCQPTPYAELAKRNQELDHQVQVLQYEAAQLNAKIGFKKARIALLRERLRDARR